AGTPVETPQDESQATLARKLNREFARIDWNRPAAEICNRIRGLYPWPGCRVRLMDEANTELNRVTLGRAAVRSGTSAPAIVGQNGEVGAGGGESVRILELQPEGKRPMTLTAYQ